MRMLLVFAFIGWVLSQPWLVLLGHFALIVGAIAVLWFISVAIEPRAALSRTGGNTIDRNYVAALESMVAEAETQVETLRGEVEQLRATRPVSEADPKAALYGRVGLSPAAPEWLVATARRAYRSQLHPDRHPEHRKQEAEKRFKLSEATFEAIEAIRS